MNVPIVAFALRETGHALAAFTRRASDEELTEPQIQQLYPAGLPLRLVPQTTMTATGNPNGRSPTDNPFSLRAQLFEPHVLPPPADQSLIARPASFTLKDGAAELTPVAVQDLASATIKIEPTAVRITLQPNPTKLIADDLAVVCAMFATNNGQTVVNSGVIQASPAAGDPAIGVIPFAGIPSGVANHFLFFIKGFLPIWDQLELGATAEREWTPPSP